MSGTGVWLIPLVLGLGAAAALWLVRLRRQGRNGARLRFLVLVKDREAVVEGFIRELFRLLATNPRVEVAVVDRGSSDATPAILERLARVLPLELWRADLQAEGGEAGRRLLRILAERPVTVVLGLERTADARALLRVARAFSRAFGGRYGARACPGGEVTLGQS